MYCTFVIEILFNHNSEFLDSKDQDILCMRNQYTWVASHKDSSGCLVSFFSFGQIHKVVKTAQHATTEKQCMQTEQNTSKSNLNRCKCSKGNQIH